MALVSGQVSITLQPTNALKKLDTIEGMHEKKIPSDI